MTIFKTGIFSSMVAVAVVGMLATGVATASDTQERSHKRGAHKLSEVDRDVMRHKWFASMDTNNDGYISEAEFVAAAVKRAEAGARAAFTRMDSDNTGEISAEQFSALAEQRRGRGARTHK